MNNPVKCKEDATVVELNNVAENNRKKSLIYVQISVKTARKSITLLTLDQNEIVHDYFLTAENVQQHAINIEVLIAEKIIRGFFISIKEIAVLHCLL